MPKRKLDWPKIESLLYDLTIAELDAVGKTYKGEPFYAFAFDVNADYGEVGLCVNTEGELRKSAQETCDREQADPKPDDKWAQLWTSIAEQPVTPGMRKSIPFFMEYLRWSLGDWAYQGFNSTKFDKGWDKTQDAVSEASIDAGDDDGGENPVSQRFLISVCKVMVRLEKENAFKRIPTTNDFKTWVGDHDELDDWSISRLESVRRGDKKVQLKSWQGTQEFDTA